MPELDLVVRAARVVTPDGMRSATVCVRDGRIVEIAALDAGRAGGTVLELASDEVLLPGLVDTHVHVNEPGRTEWEGFASATQAAAAGGVTTLVDMPLNSVPPTVSVDALRVKREAAHGQAYVDVGFWGGIVPGNETELPGLHAAGVLGFKCFLSPSGVDEFPPVSIDELRRALGVLQPLDALTLVHAEDPQTLDDAPPPHGRSYRDFLASRPSAAEEAAIAAVVALARQTGARMHVLHLSSASALDLLRSAQRDGLNISAETCPHYLALSAEHVPDGATSYKCCPPIRDAANRDRLWTGLVDGTVSCVVSDHSPCPGDLKSLGTGDFGTAWGGIASLQLGLSVIWTQARERALTLEDVVRWMSTAPADLVGLGHKGRVAVGADADLCVLAPDESFVVEPAALHHRHPLTPYAGRHLHGVVRSTWLAGRRISSAAPVGRLLERSR